MFCCFCCCCCNICSESDRLLTAGFLVCSHFRLLSFRKHTLDQASIFSTVHLGEKIMLRECNMASKARNTCTCSDKFMQIFICPSRGSSKMLSHVRWHALTATQHTRIAASARDVSPMLSFFTRLCTHITYWFLLIHPS